MAGERIILASRAGHTTAGGDTWLVKAAGAIGARASSCSGVLACEARREATQDCGWTGVTRGAGLAVRCCSARLVGSRAAARARRGRSQGVLARRACREGDEARGWAVVPGRTRRAGRHRRRRVEEPCEAARAIRRPGVGLVEPYCAAATEGRRGCRVGSTWTHARGDRKPSRRAVTARGTGQARA